VTFDSSTEVLSADSGLPHGLTTSLLAKLNAAQSDFQAGSMALVCSDLQDLINEAGAQSGKGLTFRPGHADHHRGDGNRSAAGLLAPSVSSRSREVF
jgi:hypothetical protein